MGHTEPGGAILTESDADLPAGRGVQAAPGALQVPCAVGERCR